MKRGESGLSLVVGVDKPKGMSSHDVVNRCRRIFGERRVGHTGTLDPLATGALAVCIGPATRLDAYFVNHDKVYDVRIAFGTATDTDDRCGQVIRTAEVPPELSDETQARAFLFTCLGKQLQTPPQYSAIKRDGKRAYEAARAGNVVELDAREITVYAADLLQTGRTEDGVLFWDVRFGVSKGTYIRSLARDIGVRLGTAAHVSELRRIEAGGLHVDQCVTLEELEAAGPKAAIDPVRLLGFRTAFLNERQQADVANGKRLPAKTLQLFEAPRNDQGDCCMTAHAKRSSAPLADGETISMVAGNTLVALYSAQVNRGMVSPCCVFAQGVYRGSNI
ncbi:tRNA pseudouridine synthase B [Slackia heliotrinireducens]|uniref:tRNA pseudouridine synthase B n=1 Tax=Slackia heliotrinireducens (strain ATCC 29202 / DSM 20476 / NCTC 11029 / RHS 1) TaxID=471855 RepID=C7N4Z5_SLAHD|nr:tRNA pseudouridine(55) synthase TruB [Slackia heliotrinireducens]ACV21980.1 tRNA pseudouridine 55 synthase [Slackia heliotrinireducens DSM 20476]VEG99859.1 tRNA pseudouridine synthase B [Slackia heliotrinireducens]